MRQNDGLEKLRTGEIAATVLTSGKPSRRARRPKASDGYRILPVPFIKTLQADYLPSALTHDDYPNLIAPGQTVETIASGTILFAYNWPKNTDRYRRIDKFVKAFFGKISEFQKAPRHPKWQDTNLAAIIPGWKRFEGSDDWLKNHREQEFAGRRIDQSVTAGGALTNERDLNDAISCSDFIKGMEPADDGIEIRRRCAPVAAVAI
jgi:hypothetical protein